MAAHRPPPAPRRRPPRALRGRWHPADFQLARDRSAPAPPARALGALPVPERRRLLRPSGAPRAVLRGLRAQPVLPHRRPDRSGPGGDARPPVASAAKQTRAIIERLYGRTVSQRFQHVAHPSGAARSARSSAGGHRGRAHSGDRSCAPPPTSRCPRRWPTTSVTPSGRAVPGTLSYALLRRLGATGADQAAEPRAASGRRRLLSERDRHPRRATPGTGSWWNSWVLLPSPELVRARAPTTTGRM